MSEENVEIARRLVDAFSRRDVDALLSLSHQDLEWHPVLTAGGMEGTVYRGEAGIRRWFAEVDDVWAELGIEVAEYRAAGENQVLQLGRFRAVGKESGVPIDRAQALLMTIVDGRLATAWGFASHQEALEAAGL